MPRKLNEIEQRNQVLAGPVVRAALAYVRANGINNIRAYLAEVFGQSKSAIAALLERQPEWKAERDAALAAWDADRAAATLEPDHPELREYQRRLKAQQADITVLRRQLDEADAKKTIVESLADVVRQEVTPWEPRPLRLPEPQKGQFLVDGVVSLTDEHADEVVTGAATWGLERYNFDVFRIRLQRWAKVLAAYMSQHLPRYHFERLWVFKLGDSQHGNLHLAGQKYRNHFGNDLRAAIAIGEAEADAVIRVLDYVPQVNVVSVPGNHPRQTPRKDYGDPHDNLDFLVTTVMELRLRNYIETGRVSVFAPRSFSAYVDVRGRVNALNHGDDVVGTWSIPWYGFSKHEQRVQALLSRTGQRVDYFWYGHFHTDLSKLENGARSIHAGAFTLTDDYVINKLKAANEPSQTFQVFDDPLGRILDIPIYLRDPKRETAYWDGKYEPELGRSSALTRLAWTDEQAKTGAFPLIQAEEVK